MSRIGKQPVTIPKGVSVTVNGQQFSVKGQKGELVQPFQPQVSFNIGDNEVNVERVDDSKRARSMHGLYRRLLFNMVVGVSEGYTKKLDIIGVGYRAEMSGKDVVLNLGYSTIITYMAPEGVTLATEGNNKIIVSGVDKAKVGQAAAEIRKLRPPEPYKGKGIRYEGEMVRRKVGKSGVK